MTPVSSAAVGNLESGGRYVTLLGARAVDHDQTIRRHVVERERADNTVFLKERVEFGALLDVGRPPPPSQREGSSAAGRQASKVRRVTG